MHMGDAQSTYDRLAAADGPACGQGLPHNPVRDAVIVLQNMLGQGEGERSDCTTKHCADLGRCRAQVVGDCSQRR